MNTTLILVLALIFWALIANLECMILHVSYGGSMKRGISIWRESLPSDIKLHLRRLEHDIWNKDKGEFIRKEGNQVLVRTPFRRMIRLPGYRLGGAFSYIACIDLGVREPMIQYRIPISTFPFLLAWLGTAVYISLQDLWGVLFLALVGAAFYWLHEVQRTRILEFIREEME